MKVLSKAILPSLLFAAVLPASAQTYNTPALQDFSSVPNLTSNTLFPTVGSVTNTVGVQSGYKTSRAIDAGANADTGGGTSPIIVRTRTQAAADANGNKKSIELTWATATDAPTASTTFIEAQTQTALPSGASISNTTALARPIVDLGGSVTISFAVDPGYYTGTAYNGQTPTAGATQQGDFDMQVALGISNGVVSGVNTSDPTILGTNGGQTYNQVVYVGNTVDAASRIGGKMVYGGSSAQGGAVVYAGTGGAAGTFVTSGSVKFTTLTFNLPTEHTYDPSGSGTTLATSGVGVLDSIYFTPVSPTPGQFWNVYIDDIQINAAPAATPEPSSWLTLAAGVMGVMGLAAVRRQTTRTRS